MVGSSWGAVDPQSYHEDVEMYTHRITREARDDEEFVCRTFEAKKADEQALAWMTEYVGIRGAVIYVTRTDKRRASKMIEALKAKRAHEDVRVILLTGLLVEDEVIMIDKSWVSKLPWRRLIG